VLARLALNCLANGDPIIQIMEAETKSIAYRFSYLKAWESWLLSAFGNVS
jgi:hypothetical protein